MRKTVSHNLEGGGRVVGHLRADEGAGAQQAFWKMLHAAALNLDPNEILQVKIHEVEPFPRSGWTEVDLGQLDAMVGRLAQNLRG